jgi:predicted nuclease of predicted toxin-antitoxin system
LAAIELRFFIDECLSPSIAVRLNEKGIDAYHPLQRGRRGAADHVILRRCIEEDRIIVTGNAEDFRGLVGRAGVHPGLVVFPCVDRETSWRLMATVLQHLELQAEPRDYMLNRVIEIDGGGRIRTYRLPAS